MGQAQSNLYQNNPAYHHGNHKNRRLPIMNETVSIHDRQYYFDRKIGQGGYGSVYSVRRVPDGQPFAVKVISMAHVDNSTASGLGESFRNELRMARSLTTVSRNIVHMFDFDFDQRSGLTFIVMELGQQDLDKYLVQKSHLSAHERKAIWRQLVDIALALHARQIVHLDIKPSNLIIFPHNLVKLADLGIAQKSYQERIGRTGTPPYSAPEVTTVSVSHITLSTVQADMWSWGAILYRMTYKVPPSYESPSYAPPERQQPAGDPHLLDILQHTLVKNPRLRHEPSWLAQHPYTKTP